MDVGAISTTIGLVKDVANQVIMLKNLTSDIETATEIQEAKQKAIDLTNTVIALQTAIMSMQADYMALAEENAWLKQEKEKKNQYKLVEYSTHLHDPILLYQSTGEGVLHYICPHCYDNEGKAIVLQQRRRHLGATMISSSYQDEFYCTACKSEYAIAKYLKTSEGVITRQSY
ncbi:MULTISPECIES: hypothetical protein [Haemophilus]|jgi:hypothetical protein|uniref:Uncharacterized protein n=1 Tax=Haemophilus parainfluenzae TaxID=729 RepID=A0AB37IIG8_HAEPA|nr:MULTISPECIES: hypothetical protein [Haemophilus]OFQ19596.1 hypothetical protein HMPREF2948_03000 [Haemophilus sp. HMSC073C03]RDE90159.1 hypothetical protein DPV97_09015 [Haemophilus parainfluenzae]RDF05428.1 hypothetical protein DPV91_08700 [Haemophilus parainfluenzae]